MSTIAGKWAGIHRLKRAAQLLLIYNFANFRRFSCLVDALGSGMTLAKIIPRKQERVGEHYAQGYIIDGNAGSNLESCRWVQLSSC